jgi:hypothetical protein
MPTAELTIQADLSGLRKQLESIPGITADQARAMSVELNKSFKSAERAAKQAAAATTASMREAEEATRRLADSGADVGDRFGKVGGAAAKLAGGLDLLAPGLGEVARGVADMADIGEVASGSLGMSGMAGAIGALTAPLAILGLALTPVIVAFLDEKHNAEAAAAALARYEAATKSASDANHAFNSTMGGVNDELKLLFGIESANEQQARKRIEQVYGQADAANAAAQALIDEAKAQRDAIAGQAKMDALRGAQTDATAQYAALSQTISEQSAIIKQNTDAAALSSEVLKANAQAQDQVEKNAKRRAAAEKAAAEQAKRLAEADRMAKEAAAAHAQDLAPLLDAEKSITAAREKELTESERLAGKLDDLIRLRGELAAKGQLSAEEDARFAAVRVDLEGELTSAIVAEEDKRQAELKALKDKAAEEDKARRDAEAAAIMEAATLRVQAMTQVLDVIAQYTAASMDSDVKAYEDAQAARDNLGKHATEAERKAADERLAITKKAAVKAFYIDKAAKMESAAAATALAVVQALGSAPPPFNYIAAAAVGAAGLVQEGIIASQAPTFHSGGMVGSLAPDEQGAIVRQGEAVLSPAGRRAIGDSTINAANAGMGGSGSIVVVNQYRHRVFDSFVQDNLRTRGPLARALGTGARTGQRRA